MRKIGLLTAVFLALGVGLPGAMAAVEGPSFQFPLCSPDGLKIPAHAPAGSVDTDHCWLCRAPTGKAGLVPARDGEPVATPASGREGPAVPRSATVSRDRAELTPVRGRAPPRFRF